MPRTTSGAVQGVLGGDYNPDYPLEPFIATASAMVDALLVYAADIEVTVSATVAELIERWLAAHCYSVMDQPFESNTTAQSSARYQGRTNMYLESRHYGQQAIMLDPTGYLRALNKGTVNAEIDWLGKPESEQIDYYDRD
jgi:hypothetical protein